jgi:uncharacterized YigZ family protein
MDAGSRAKRYASGGVIQGYNLCMPNYPIPARETRAEIRVANSRFIATLAPVFSVEAARSFIARIRAEFSGATHNVPAFVVGHGASVITHSSDDGEPSGTAGRPALAVLSGSGLGDAAVVVTRYFGGTKLGTGGLVRAYGDAVRAVLDVTPHARKVPTHLILLVSPYNWYDRLLLLIAAHGGQVEEQDFAADITLSMRIPAGRFPAFQEALREASHGTLVGEIIATEEMIVAIE